MKTHRVKVIDGLVPAEIVCVVTLWVLSLVGGCAGNNPKETRPTPVSSPIVVTNPPGESMSGSSTNSLASRRISTRAQPQTLQARQDKTRTLREPEQKLEVYDKAFVDSVKQHWYDLLDRSGFNYETKGKVILEFRLLRDGSISDIEVVQTTVNAKLTKLCKQALLDPAPFRPWPRSMRLQIGKDYREITFTFYFDWPPSEASPHPARP